MEVDIILKYSPFKTKNQLFECFNRIEGQSGTLIVLYNIVVRSNTRRVIVEIDKNSKDLISKTNAINDE